MGREIQRVLVDRALQRSGLASYAELAERVGVTAPTLSQWRQGINPIPEKRLEQLCKISGDDVGVFRLAIMAEETKIVSLRKSIESVLRDAGRKVPTATVALLVLLGASTLPGVGARDAQAAAQSASGHEKAAGLCIMRSCLFRVFMCRPPPVRL